MSLFAKNNEVGVLPVPPTYIFPTQIIGISKERGLMNLLLKKTKISKMVDMGRSIIEIKLLLFQYFGFDILIRQKFI